MKELFTVLNGQYAVLTVETNNLENGTETFGCFDGYPYKAGSKLHNVQFVDQFGNNMGRDGTLEMVKEIQVIDNYDGSFKSVLKIIDVDYIEEVKKMNYLQLKAKRQGLGLNVAEIAEIARVTKRSFQYWEAGRVPVPHDVEMLFDAITSQYNLVLDLLLSDVELVTWRNTDPDNNPNKPMRISPTLPFFHSYELFLEKTGVKNIVYWRIYQSVVSQLILTGKIVRLNDESEIPKSWGIWKWLNGHYDTN